MLSRLEAIDRTCIVHPGCRLKPLLTTERSRTQWPFLWFRRGQGSHMAVLQKISVYLDIKPRICWLSYLAIISGLRTEDRPEHLYLASSLITHLGPRKVATSAGDICSCKGLCIFHLRMRRFMQENNTKFQSEKNIFRFNHFN